MKNRINHSIQGKVALRKGPWKLVFCPGSGGWSAPNDNAARKAKLPELQLYNLSTDPLETTNVMYENPELVQTLTQKLHTLIKQGRSTIGVPQQNVGQTWLPNL